MVYEILNKYYRRAWVYPGGTIAPILDDLDKNGFEIITARSEQGAGMAAVSAAKLLGEPQLVMVTSGPGITNLVTCLAEAYYDNIGMLVIAGQSSLTKRGRRIKQLGFQEADTEALVSSVCDDYFSLDEMTAVPLLNEAIERSFQGVVVVEVPIGVLS